MLAAATVEPPAAPEAPDLGEPAFAELARLDELARARGRVADVMVRVTVGVEAHTHEFIATAHEDQKFGFSLATGDAAEAVRRLSADPSLPFVSALLDQRSIAGLGNLWVNELAFLTGVSPWTPIGDVDVERLVDDFLRGRLADRA